jgi:hypothetical protein
MTYVFFPFLYCWEWVFVLGGVSCGDSWTQWDLLDMIALRNSKYAQGTRRIPHNVQYFLTLTRFRYGPQVSNDRSECARNVTIVLGPSQNSTVRCRIPNNVIVVTPCLNASFLSNIAPQFRRSTFVALSHERRMCIGTQILAWMLQVQLVSLTQRLRFLSFEGTSCPFVLVTRPGADVLSLEFVFRMRMFRWPVCVGSNSLCECGLSFTPSSDYPRIFKTLNLRRGLKLNIGWSGRLIT